jgi:hypothetical protein
MIVKAGEKIVEVGAHMDFFLASQQPPTPLGKVARQSRKSTREYVIVFMNWSTKPVLPLP